MIGTITSRADLARAVAFERAQKAAHTAVARAVRRGVLTRTWICFECEAPSTDVRFHHDDYTRPLDVLELCPPCHDARHRRLGWGVAGFPDGWQL